MWPVEMQECVVHRSDSKERDRIGLRMAEVRVGNHELILLAGYSRRFLSPPVS